MVLLHAEARKGFSQTKENGMVKRPRCTNSQRQHQYAHKVDKGVPTEITEALMIMCAIELFERSDVAIADTPGGKHS